MKYIPIVIITIIVACKAEDAEQKKISQIESDIRAYHGEILRQIDSTHTLDTVRVVRLDTLTEKDRLEAMGDYLLDKNDELKVSMEEIQNDIQYHLKMMRLTVGISPSLYKNAETDYQSRSEEFKGNIAKMKTLIGKADSLYALAKVSDSSKVVNYEVVWYYQWTRRDKTVKRDTGYAFMTPDFKLIKRDDFYSPALKEL